MNRIGPPVPKFATIRRGRLKSHSTDALREAYLPWYNIAIYSLLIITFIEKFSRAQISHFVKKRLTKWSNCVCPYDWYKRHANQETLALASAVYIVKEYYVISPHSAKEQTRAGAMFRHRPHRRTLLYVFLLTEGPGRWSKVMNTFTMAHGSQQPTTVSLVAAIVSVLDRTPTPNLWNDENGNRTSVCQIHIRPFMYTQSARRFFSYRSTHFHAPTLIRCQRRYVHSASEWWFSHQIKSIFGEFASHQICVHVSIVSLIQLYHL